VNPAKNLLSALAEVTNIMKSRLSFLLLVFAVSIVAVPSVFARSFDISANAVWVDPNSNGTFNANNPNRPGNISFNGDLGYGASANIFFGNAISLELGGSVVKPKANLSGLAATGGTASGNVRMIPLTAVLQWHFIPNGVIDPYIGGGAAYILFDRFNNSNDPSTVGIRQIDFKDDAGFAANAGVQFRISPNFAITADGKYVPLRTSATAVFITGPNTSNRIKINPVIFTGGLTFRF
jgi:outer membrane protein